MNKLGRIQLDCAVLNPKAIRSQYYNVTRAALPVMHAQRDGHIIQISSIGGRRSTPGLGAYQSAKWAIGGFNEALAREVAPLGIRVTCVEPVADKLAAVVKRVFPEDSDRFVH